MSLWLRFCLALSCFFHWNLSTSRYLLDCKHLVLEWTCFKRSNGTSNQSTLTPLPFTSSTRDLNLGIELSFRPSVTFVVAIGGLPVSVQVAVTLDIPALDAVVSQVHNVNVSCDAAPASLPTDQVYENLTMIVPSIGVDALEVFQAALNLVLVKPADTEPFSQSFSTPLPTACYAFSRAQRTLVAAAQSKPSDTSSATSVHVPLSVVAMAVILAVFTAI